MTRRGRRPVLPRTEAASLRVLEREKRKRARKELLNFYAWQHRETKMERKGVSPARLPAPLPMAPALWTKHRAPEAGAGPGIWARVSLGPDFPTGVGVGGPSPAAPVCWSPTPQRPL